MATIIQEPDNGYACSLKDLIIEGDCTVSITLYHNNQTIALLSNTHFITDSAGRVTIPIRSMLRNMLDHDYDKYVPSAELEIDINGSIRFYLITDGAELNDEGVDDYIRTIAPQVQSITGGQPLKISVLAYGDEECYIVVTGYYANGREVETTINAQHQAEQSIITLDISYTTVNAKLRAIIESNYPSWVGSKDCVAFDVNYTIKGYDLDIKPRRFILREPKLEDKFFVFQNQRGGYDVICFTGEEVINTSSSPERYTALGVEHELMGTPSIEYSINTGYNKDEAHRVWVLDFLRSNHRWLIDESGEMIPIVVDIDKAEYTIRALNSYSFKYRKANPLQELIVPQRTDLEQFIYIK